MARGNQPAKKQAAKAAAGSRPVAAGRRIAASGPLTGKRIIVTRAPEQAGELIRRLERRGAQVFLLPAVKFAPPKDWTALDAALRQLPRFDWVLFTSQNAVRFFAARAAELSIAIRSADGRPMIAAVGPATAKAAVEEGMSVDYVAKEHTDEALAREMRETLASRAVLLPRSNRADERLPTALWEAGACVTEAAAYRVVAPEELDPAIVKRIRRKEADAIVFASPSAFQNLSTAIPASVLAKLSRRIQFAAIGPTTALALRESGVRVEIEAEEASSAGLVGAIVKYYERQGSKEPR